MGLFDRLFGRKKEKQEEAEQNLASSEVLEDSAQVSEDLTVEEQPSDAVQEQSDTTNHSVSENLVQPQDKTEVMSEAPDPSWVKDVLDSENFMADYNALKSSLAEDNDILSEAVRSSEDTASQEISSEVAETAKKFEHEEPADALKSPETTSLTTDYQPQVVSSKASLTSQSSQTYQAAEDKEAEPVPQAGEAAQAADVSETAQSSVSIANPVQEVSAVPSQEQENQLDQDSANLSTQETEQEKYNRSLKKTRTGLGARLNAFFANFRRVDEDFFEDLEEMLILSDVGVQVATNLTEDLRYEVKLENAKKTEDVRRVVIEKLVDIYEKDGHFNEKINFQDDLTVMLFVGVNGVGKTTSIGKLAYKYKNQGKKVMLVAADTFRAGAVAQLVEWGNRVGVPVVTGPEKADPASVVFDGMEKAVVEGVDVLMIDTAGRLQNKENLMAELGKISRIVKRVVPDAPHETLLALDASTGQNALSQAKEFSKITPLTGLVLTKIDGTAKGGVVLAIRQELDIPVKFIGFGEKIDDIGEFHSEEFMKGLLEGLI
ncbi:signal recognition particle-docking protein FtsY [Streptococcus tangpeifui]|uniref:signal recognition particle-docking protein FtsY n=1 Tax=Streptococcus tangpeifui TaxID=2709400 RepID=UPI0013EE313D|nr:signal recognition particle-docking protein FtsY [Streptococcus sp. ZJ1593]